MHAEAGHQVAALGRLQRRHLLALVDGEATARAEPAALRRRQQIGRRSVDGGELGAAAAVEPRHGRQQAARIGMQRAAEHGLRGAALHQARGIHDVHAVGVARDDAEVVRDDDDRDAEPPRQVLHQLEDLRLDGHVQRRGRLVGDQELGVAGQTDGDHHPLAHATRQLMRILRQPARGVGDADQGQQLDGAGARLRLAHLEVDEQRLHDLQADAQHGVERGHRLLEDHGDLPAAQLPHLLLGEGEQLPAIEADVALDACGARRQQSHRRQCGHGFARAGLSDDGHHLARIDGIAQPLDGAHRAVRGHELHVQVVDLDDGTRRKAAHSRCRRLCKRPISEARDDLVVHPNVLPSTNGQLLVCSQGCWLPVAFCTPNPCYPTRVMQSKRIRLYGDRNGQCRRPMSRLPSPGDGWVRNRARWALYPANRFCFAVTEIGKTFSSISQARHACCGALLGFTMEVRMTDSILYHDGNRRLQDAFDSRRIADRLESKLARTSFTDDDKAFIESAIYFFLATADAAGRPDSSFKGGPPGFVRVTAANELAFPDYDGNGMFKSLGNLLENPHVGLLFIDMHGKPRRLRINGEAKSLTRRPAARHHRRRATDRARDGERHLPQLSALYPQARSRRALDLHAQARLRSRRAGVERLRCLQGRHPSAPADGQGRWLIQRLAPAPVETRRRHR